MRRRNRRGRVADATRRIDERACHAFNHIVAVLQANLTGQHQEELILALVGMKRRSETLRRPQLRKPQSDPRSDQPSPSNRARLNHKNLAVVGAQRIGTAGVRKRHEAHPELETCSDYDRVCPWRAGSQAKLGADGPRLYGRDQDGERTPRIGIVAPRLWNSRSSLIRLGRKVRPHWILKSGGRFLRGAFSRSGSLQRRNVCDPPWLSWRRCRPTLLSASP